MKNKALHFFTVLALGAAAIFIAGCAGMEAHNTKSLLSAAGFHVKTPQTPLQKEVYAAMPANHVQRISAEGKTIYAFKDEDEGVAYVGREQEYQRYRQLCIQQQIAQDYYMAASMNTYYSHRYYGAWGRHYW